MVVSNGTFLQRKVEKLKVGFCIDSKNEKEIENVLASINMEEVNNIINTEYSIEAKELIDAPDSLIHRLLKIAK